MFILILSLNLVCGTDSNSTENFSLSPDGAQEAADQQKMKRSLNAVNNIRIENYEDLIGRPKVYQGDALSQQDIDWVLQQSQAGEIFDYSDSEVVNRNLEIVLHILKQGHLLPRLNLSKIKLDDKGLNLLYYNLADNQSHIMELDLSQT